MNHSLVQNGSLTERGLDIYWKSLDSAVGYNVQKRDQFLAKASDFGVKRRQAAPVQSEDEMKQFFKKDRNDQFHWHNVARGEDRYSRKNDRFLLPRLRH